MEKSGRRFQIAADFQQSQGRDGSFRDGGFRDLETEADVGLPGEVVEFLRFDAGDQAAQSRLVTEIGVVQLEGFSLFAKVFDPRAVELTGAADEPVDGVAFIQKKFCKIGAILTGNS